MTIKHSAIMDKVDRARRVRLSRLAIFSHVRTSSAHPCTTG